jgi:DNA (cytosine-5)-methyltransferase 1
MNYIDLFCGMGGFRIAVENVFRRYNIIGKCVFSSDIDRDSKTIYKTNFSEEPADDICRIEASQIPEHDLLLAGFPCQPFSIMGTMQGFEDTRGTLFFEIARILEHKTPKIVVLENVKQLVGHDKGRTLKRILETLNSLGYYTDYRVLNALNFGLPQKRERVFIVGFREPVKFNWIKKSVPMLPLEKVLEDNVSDFYYASEAIKTNRLAKRIKIEAHRTIWHENKGGHISAYPFSCALRAGASYNYLLVDGERRLTEREMLRLQGFPESYQIVGGYNSIRKLTGNSLAIPVAEAVIEAVVEALMKAETALIQTPLFELATV